MWNGWNYVREKYESLSVPPSISSKAMACSLSHIICWNNFSSSGQRNSLALTLSSFILSRVILDVGIKLGGQFVRGDNVRSGFSGIFLVTSQSMGSCIEIG